MAVPKSGCSMISRKMTDTMMTGMRSRMKWSSRLRGKDLGQVDDHGDLHEFRGLERRPGRSPATATEPLALCPMPGTRTRASSDERTPGA